MNGSFFHVLKLYPGLIQHLQNLFIEQCTPIGIILITWEEFFPEFSSSNAFRCTAVEVSK